MVASQDIGELGPNKTEAVSIQWRWYYQLPPLLVWAPVFILLVFVKSNHNLQAVALLIVALLLNLLVRPLFLSMVPFSAADNNYSLGFELNSFVAFWTAFWLSLPLLVNQKRIVIFFFAFVFMVGLGIAADCSNFGTWYLRNQEFHLYLLGVITLVLAMPLSSLRCRKTYKPPRFLLWVLIWSLLVSGFIAYPMILAIMAMDSHFLELILQRPSMLIGAVPYFLLYGWIVYMINLPFMFWVIKAPYYHDCFRIILRLPEPRKVSSAENSDGSSQVKLQ